MSKFDNYHFIYKDINGRWNEATNPSFIAMHKECKAIEKAKIKSISEYLWKLNK